MKFLSSNFALKYNDHWVILFLHSPAPRRPPLVTAVNDATMSTQALMRTSTTAPGHKLVYPLLNFNHTFLSSTGCRAMTRRFRAGVTVVISLKLNLDGEAASLYRSLRGSVVRSFMNGTDPEKLGIGLSR
jgi:hypothetical protein